MPETGPGPESATTVRSARPGDLDLLVRYILCVARESEGEELDEHTVARGVREALEDGEHRRLFIVERDGEPVGSCLVTTEWSDWNAAWYWWLQSVYIEKEHRGKDKGVLQVLLDHLREQAKTQKVRQIKLYVHQENSRAVHAYEGQGYRRTPYFIYQHDV